MKKRKRIIIFVIIIGVIICSKKYIFSEAQNSECTIKNVEIATTQLADKNSNTYYKENKEKIQSILYGIIQLSGECEEEYNKIKVEEELKKFTNKNGVFISERARDKVIKLLRDNTNIQYSIDSQGYLINKSNEQTNDTSKKINDLITLDKCTIIDYNQYYYCILGKDICTFKIEETEYMEKFQHENTTILILNPTKYENEHESKKLLVNNIINNTN